MRIVAIFAAFAALFFLSGCAPQVQVRALQPAEVDKATNLKQIAVTEFKLDRIGFASKLESSLAEHRLGSETYFVVVDRNRIDQIISEQRFQHSGLVEETSKMVEVGKLVGAQALISGTVSSADHSDSYSREPRCRRYEKGKGCVEPYTVSCTTRTVNLGAQIKMVDISRGDIVTSQSLSDSKRFKHCEDSYGGLPTPAQVHEQLADQMCAAFVKKIAPSYIYYKVTLITKLDAKLPSEEKKKFDNANNFVKNNRLDRAEKLYTELMEATSGQSTAISYNLGVVKEALGEYKEAKKLYQNADQQTDKPAKEINTALKRIDVTIEKHEKATKQIGR